MPLITRQLSNIGAPLYHPNGTLMTNVKVSFSLVDSSSRDTDAFDITSSERVAGTVSATTNSFGEFTLSLWPNDRGDKTTKYLCRAEGLPVFVSQIPSGAGTLSWYNFKHNGAILTPDTLLALDIHIADALLHLTSAQNTLLDGISPDISSAEINMLDGATSNIQAQINAIPNINLKANVANPVFTGNVVTEKTAGIGMKLGTAVTNSFGWNDLIGILSHAKGGVSPVLSPVIGGQIQEYAYAVGEQGGNAYHIKHDHLPNSDTFIHIHWLHNGTAISGNLVVTFYVTYAKSHNQAAFTAEKVITLTVPTPDILTIPQYRHMLSEIQLSSLTPTANQLDSALLEPDGEILLHMNITTAPTTVGASRLNSIFILHADIHYQTTGVATINRTPNFYI